MPVDVILPRVDMDMVSGRISRWFVAEGDIVKKGQVLFEIETDKSAMEVDSPTSGIIKDISGASSGDILVGSSVARIFQESEPYTGKTAVSSASASTCLSEYQWVPQSACPSDSSSAAHSGRRCTTAPH